MDSGPFQSNWGDERIRGIEGGRLCKDGPERMVLGEPFPLKGDTLVMGQKRHGKDMKRLVRSLPYLKRVC